MGGANMKRKSFTEEQIITMPKEHEAGMRVNDLEWIESGAST